MIWCGVRERERERERDLKHNEEQQWRFGIVFLISSGLILICRVTAGSVGVGWAVSLKTLGLSILDLSCAMQ